MTKVNGEYSYLIVLREIRKKKGMSQEDASSALGVSQAYLSKIERGKSNVSLSTLNRMCEIYEVPMALVMWGSITEGDVPSQKLTAYRELKPVIDSLIESVFFTKEE